MNQQSRSSADKHRRERRKDGEASPSINHAPLADQWANAPVRIPHH
jgi:hypothetical protein